MTNLSDIQSLVLRTCQLWGWRSQLSLALLCKTTFVCTAYLPSGSWKSTRSDCLCLACVLSTEMHLAVCNVICSVPCKRQQHCGLDHVCMWYLLSVSSNAASSWHWVCMSAVNVTNLRLLLTYMLTVLWYGTEKGNYIYFVYKSRRDFRQTFRIPFSASSRRHLMA